MCRRQHKHQPLPILEAASGVSGPTKCQRRSLNLMNNLHGWYSSPRCHPSADVCCGVFTLQNNIAVSQTSDAHHSNVVVVVVVVPAPELHQHTWWKPFQAFPKTAQAGKGGGGERIDIERGGRRPGIEITTLKHLWSRPGPATASLNTSARSRFLDPQPHLSLLFHPTFYLFLPLLLSVHFALPVFLASSDASFVSSGWLQHGRAKSSQ